MKRLALLAIAIVLLLCSCVTRSPYKEEQYFQAMGLDGQFVFTINAQLLDPTELISSEDQAVQYIASRMDRLSIALNEDSSFYGAIEGNFPKVLVNSALRISSQAQKLKDSETGLKYFRLEGSEVEASIPKSGIILFSNSDVVDTYMTTMENRVKRISDEDAKKLASSQIGFYVANPKTMLDMGFEIPKTALENISNVLLVMDDNVISVDFTLRTEELAKTFSIIIKAGYIAKLKLSGQSVDISALKEMFTQELEKVSVTGIELTQQQISDIRATVFSLIDMI